MEPEAMMEPATLKERIKLDSNYKWLVLATAAIGTFMGTMDASIVNISLPVLSEVFDTTPDSVLWVTLVYLLVGTGLMLTVGRLGDTLGRKRVYSMGFLLFSLGLALCSIAQNLPQLVLYRVVQAIGASIVIATGAAIVTAAFPEQERGKSLGLLGATVGAGLATGPLLGGFLLDTLGWRSIFFVRVPVGLIGSAMALKILRPDGFHGPKPRFDIWGALALFGTLSSFLTAINRGQIWGWSSAPIVGLLLAAAVFFALFFYTEARITYPVVDLSLFRTRIFAAATSATLLNFFAWITLVFLTPFYLMLVLNYSSFISGLFMTTVPILMFVLAPLSGWLSDRLGSRILSTTGLGIISLGLLRLQGLDTSSTGMDVILHLGVVGIGMGLFEAPNNSSIMGATPKERLGTASAMVATARQVGMATGLAIAGAVFTARLGDSPLLGESLGQPAAIVRGFHDALQIGFFFAFAAGIISFARGRSTSPLSRSKRAILSKNIDPEHTPPALKPRQVDNHRS
ncbi:MAG: MFS transporter [Chloroflexi bacterium]|nr:MFS transporter [Chloroflexota bacterium]